MPVGHTFRRSSGISRLFSPAKTSGSWGLKILYPRKKSHPLWVLFSSNFSFPLVPQSVRECQISPSFTISSSAEWKSSVRGLYHLSCHRRHYEYKRYHYYTIRTKPAFFFSFRAHFSHLDFLPYRPAFARDRSEPQTLFKPGFGHLPQSRVPALTGSNPTQTWVRSAFSYLPSHLATNPTQTWILLTLPRIMEWAMGAKETNGTFSKKKNPEKK